MKKQHFGPELFTFFKELRKNNNRDWFKANKTRYESAVRGPMLEFISDLGVFLEKISPNLSADPRPSGGSMFRIYRDTRFSNDKSPYKLQAAARFRHVRGKEIHAPGYYLHLEPGSVFAGAGVWHPDNPTLTKIRDAIVRDPDRWKQVVPGRTSGESLKRPPRGYDPDHPLIEDLKRKDFVTITRFTQAQASADDFMDRYARACRDTAPFMKFLTEAVGLTW
jgi:uncharacterized protein (TIGR02453 family)